MANGKFQIPKAINEVIDSYAPGTNSRKTLLNTYESMLKESVDIPMFINGKEVEQMIFVIATHHMTIKEKLDNFIMELKSM